jgi:hypothetical protein
VELQKEDSHEENGSDRHTQDEKPQRGEATCCVENGGNPGWDGFVRRTENKTRFGAIIHKLGPWEGRK